MSADQSSPADDHQTRRSPPQSSADDNIASASAVDRNESESFEQQDLMKCAWCGSDIDGVEQRDDVNDDDKNCRNRRKDDVQHSSSSSSFNSSMTYDERLRFCSRSCLSRYKMHLFCTETQQYLQQLQVARKDECISDGKLAAAGDKADERILITPELWTIDEPDANAVKRLHAAETGGENGVSKVSQGRHEDDLSKPRDRKRHHHSPAATKRVPWSSPTGADVQWRQSTAGSVTRFENDDPLASRSRVSSQFGERESSSNGITGRSSSLPAACIKSECVSEHPQAHQPADGINQSTSPNAGRSGTAVNGLSWPSPSLAGSSSNNNMLPPNLFSYPSLQSAAWTLPPPPVGPMTVPVTPLLYPPSLAQPTAAAGVPLGMLPPSKLFNGAMWPGPVPPSTMLVPYPVPIPLPVPIPIPIPIPVPIPIGCEADLRRQESSASTLDGDISPPPNERQQNCNVVELDRHRDIAATSLSSVDVKRLPVVDRSPPSSHLSPVPNSSSFNIGTSPPLMSACHASPTGSNSVTSSSDMSATGVLDLSSSGCRSTGSPHKQPQDLQRLNQPATNELMSGGNPSPFTCHQLTLPLPYLARRNLILDAPSVPRADKSDCASNHNSSSVGANTRGRHSLSSVSKRNIAVHRHRKVPYIKTK